MTLAALVLAAGRGERLRPLTDETPKPLLRVGATTLLDAALERVAQVVPVTPSTVAVNAHWHADRIAAHVGDRAHVAVEEPAALGTAGAVGNLLGWLAGRDLLVANADAYFEPAPDVAGFVAGWDGGAPRLLVVDDPARADFAGRWRFAGVSLLPWRVARTLDAAPSGLYEAVWSRGPVDLVPTDVAYVDCGTLDDLRRARAMATRNG